MLKVSVIMQKTAVGMVMIHCILLCLYETTTGKGLRPVSFPLQMDGLHGHFRCLSSSFLTYNMNSVSDMTTVHSK